MCELIYVVVKDHENSGYVWDDSFCPEYLDRMLKTCAGLEILRRSSLTLHYVSRLYPQVVNEPVCVECDLIFVR